MFDLCVVGARSLDWWKRIQSDIQPAIPRLGKQIVMTHIVCADFLVRAYELGMRDVLYSSLPTSDIVERCLQVLNGERDISALHSPMELSAYMSKDSVFRIMKDESDIAIMMRGCKTAPS